MKPLQKKFTSRVDLINYVKSLSPQLSDDEQASNFLGGRRAAEEKLANIDPINYAKSRNYLDGKVTRLSPYIRHGILTLNEVKIAALQHCSEAVQIGKFIQELAWRDFWQRVYYQHPEWIWQDIEAYKTGFNASEYSDELPEDIANASTKVACINAFSRQLVEQGYLHNHARMYLAAYLVHFRRVKWQVGAKWFLRHLVDGDPASNNFSWQWVASTFSNKPYIFNLENVQKYAGNLIDTSDQNNQELAESYEALNQRLFPRLHNDD